GAQVLQVELQAARQHGDRQLLRIRRREQELHVRRRLFERFQQRVEAVRRQHVHFVDQVNLETPAARRVLHVLEQLARVFDLRARGCVDFDEIQETAFADFAAGAALAARRGGDALFAVQATREDARNRRLADTTRAGEEIGMMQTLVVERVDQGL